MPFVQTRQAHGDTLPAEAHTALDLNFSAHVEGPDTGEPVPYNPSVKNRRFLTAPLTQGSLLLQYSDAYGILTKMKAGFLYDQDTFLVPWQDSGEFLKTLVPLRKFAFLN